LCRDPHPTPRRPGHGDTQQRLHDLPTPLVRPGPDRLPTGRRALRKPVKTRMPACPSVRFPIRGTTGRPAQRRGLPYPPPAGTQGFLASSAAATSRNASVSGTPSRWTRSA
jgi:hypothetical protein